MESPQNNFFLYISCIYLFDKQSEYLISLVFSEEPFNYYYTNCGVQIDNQN